MVRENVYAKSSVKKKKSREVLGCARPESKSRAGISAACVCVSLCVARRRRERERAREIQGEGGGGERERLYNPRRRQRQQCDPTALLEICAAPVPCVSSSGHSAVRLSRSHRSSGAHPLTAPPSLLPLSSSFSSSVSRSSLTCAAEEAPRRTACRLT